MLPSALSEFLRGARRGVPMIVTAPFGVLFGALAVENGLTVGEAVLMSATIYGGASQMVGIELFGQRIAPALVVFSIFAVNFRHVLYSAAIGGLLSGWPLWRQAVAFFFLIDPQYAEAEREREEGRPLTFAWWMGMAIPIYLIWLLEAYVGATFGRLLLDTDWLNLDFLLPIYFLGLVMGFRGRPLWLPIVALSAAASMLAFRFVGSPWHVPLGALAGILLAATLPPSRSDQTA